MSSISRAYYPRWINTKQKKSLGVTKKGEENSTGSQCTEQILRETVISCLLLKRGELYKEMILPVHVLQTYARNNIAYQSQETCHL